MKNTRAIPIAIFLLFSSVFYQNNFHATYATGEDDICAYLGNFSKEKIRDIYYKNDDSLQLGIENIIVKINGGNPSDSSLYDARGKYSGGNSIQLNNGSTIDISFENSIFDNFRTLDEISFIFSTSAVKVSYSVIHTSGGTFSEVYTTSTPLADNTSYESYHNISNLHSSNDFQNVYKIRFTLTTLDSSISSFYLRELDLELLTNPASLISKKDQINLDITVPEIFSNHALLKHQSNPKVYGYGGGSNGNEVEVSLYKDSELVTRKIAVVNNYKWSTSLDKVPAGVGYSLVIKGHNTLTFTDIAFGEVYLVSGQSNMQRTMAKLDGDSDEDYIWKGYATEILTPLKTEPNTNLRLFNQSGDSLRNQRITDLNSDGWTITTFDTAYNFSAVGYFFGDALQKSLGIPVGLIYAAVGGSKIQEWLDKDLLMASTEADLAPEQVKCANYYNGYSSNHSTESTGNYFNSMIRPIGNYTISGVAWYQGESNAGARNYYHKLMDILERSFKSIFDNENLPFLVSQLAPYNVSGYNHHYIANIQAEMQYVLPNTYTTVIYDTITEPNFSNIHPQNKKPVGERLANLAREVIYGEDIEAMCPFVSEVEFDEELAIVVFDHVGRGFDVSEPIIGFEVSEDGTKFYSADAIVMGNMVICMADEVNHVSAVRYAYNRTFTGNLKTVDGLPASIYASDVLIQPISVKREIKSHISTKQNPITITDVKELPSKVKVIINDVEQEVEVVWDDVSLTSGNQVVYGSIYEPQFLKISMNVTLIDNSANITLTIIFSSIGGVVLLGGAILLIIVFVKRQKRRNL